ncbi:glycosyltransferase family 1 protein [Flavobacterium sp.]|uniref:glycosyltransferase family 4 protein n=1 Tax=Flavobacterium sp. TaxID=239 RepID=UPI00260E184E|nr:glycosyltransferase family 1 protein [Flavobacterium sp.]
MKILLDPQIFNSQKYGGISRYYTEIFSALFNKNKAEIEIPLYFTNNVYFNESVLITKSQKKNSFLLRSLSNLGISIRKITKKKNNSNAAKAMSHKEYDLFIPTYFDPYFLEHIGSKPFVLTVYDMIHELFPKYFESNDPIAKNKLLLMEKATKIIAVSQNTKNDIIRIYPHIDAEKIEVIYHGNSIKIDPTISVQLPSNYILFVGVRENYKNFNFFINAINELLKNDPTLHVVCAGGGKFNQKEIQFIKSLGFENQIIHKNFKENELGQFYKKAKCFVFPSMYEGFGIPVLEAMACGCPIVLGHHSSFPEVAGNAGVYFDLNDSEDLKNKISPLLNDENLRNDYIEKGFIQVQKFNWETAAEQCFELYKKAINKDSHFIHQKE